MGSKHRHTSCGRYGTSRPNQIRPTLPVVIVVTDDTRTAPAYFTELKREVKAKVTVRVEPAPCSGATPDDVLTHAINLSQSLGPKQPDDSTWVLLDMEAEAYKQTQALQSQQRAASTDVTVLLSNPCYEIWTLAHFIDTGEVFANCSAVVERIRIEWQNMFGTSFGNKKAQADYSKLMPLRATAVRNAKKRDQRRDPSWTEVFRVVEVITSFA